MLSGRGYYGYGGAFNHDQHRRDADEAKQDELIAGNRLRQQNARAWLILAHDAKAVANSILGLNLIEEARMVLRRDVALPEWLDFQEVSIYDNYRELEIHLPDLVRALEATNKELSPLAKVPLTAHNRSRWP